MSEFFAGEKTEQPTPRRLDEAQRHGQFPRSADVQTAFVFVAGLMSLAFFGEDIWKQFVNTFVYTLSNLHKFSVTQDSLQRYLIGGSIVLGQCVGPIVGAAALAGLLAGGIQSRFSTVSEALTANWTRLNPITGFRRVFSMQSSVPTIMGAVKLSVIIGLSYSVVNDVLTDPIFYASVSAGRVAVFLMEASFKVTMRVAVILCFIAAIDYGYQYWRIGKQLMMTKEEVKDEMKSSEGDPKMKARQRRQRGAFTMRKMMTEVPKADVVVTNPTHLAIALRYDRHTMKAPKIVAKGARLNAQRIREIAQRHQVPIVENKALARLMYKYGKVGGEIPAQLYRAVAEVLAWVYRVNRYRYYAEQNAVPRAME